MLDRCDPRVPLALTVRVWGVGTDGRAFLHSALTVDVSRRGARLTSVASLPERGMTIGLQHGKRQKQFQVAWVGDAHEALIQNAGVHSDQPDNRFWGVPQLAARAPGVAPNPELRAAAPVVPLPSLASAWTGEERRHSARHAGAETAFIVQDGSRFPITGSLVDISRSGCYVETVTPLPVQTLVKLMVPAIDNEFRVHGIVRLCHDCMGIGVEFKELSEKDSAHLEQFLSRLADA
jgi:hypothetical protein